MKNSKRMNKNFQIIEKLKKDLKDNPKNVELLNKIAICYFRIENLIEAEFYYKKALTIDPNNIYVLNNLAILKQRYSPKESIPLYKKIMTNLEKINRVSWIDSMHEKVLNKNNFKKRRERAWEKIKFNPKNEYELKILKKLSFLRETFAIKENKPPKRFIENKVLIKLCKFQLKPHEKKEAFKNIKNQRLGIAIKKILERHTLWSKAKC